MSSDYLSYDHRATIIRSSFDHHQIIHLSSNVFWCLWMSSDVVCASLMRSDTIRSSFDHHLIIIRSSSVSSSALLQLCACSVCVYYQFIFIPWYWWVLLHIAISYCFWLLSSWPSYDWFWTDVDCFFLVLILSLAFIVLFYVCYVMRGLALLFYACCLGLRWCVFMLAKVCIGLFWSLKVPIMQGFWSLLCVMLGVLFIILLVC